MTVETTSLTIESARLIAIVRLDSATASVRAVEALAKGGIRVVELSLAAPDALWAIAQCAEALSDELLIGAGTVLTAGDAIRAAEAGAKFLVSPNVDSRVADQARALELLHIPGAFTPTEVARAIAMGARLVKLFPAAQLGPQYVRDLLAPFPDAKLIPTGGVHEHNARAFLDAGACAVALGSALVSPALAGDADALAAHARRMNDLINAIERVPR